MSDELEKYREMSQKLRESHPDSEAAKIAEKIVYHLEELLKIREKATAMQNGPEKDELFETMRIFALDLKSHIERVKSK